MRLDRNWRSRFGGNIGQELNALADAIRASQVIRSAGMQTKETSTGTVIIPKASAGNSEQKNIDIEYMVISDPTESDLPSNFDVTTWNQLQQMVLLGTPSDADGNTTSDTK